ncbi:hypothetical protein Malapachy_3716 [Malassezia pachydermatis]|uniref:Vacuolar protein sorting-associated protein 28 n=1 Tax=Malassezia pachydermatis TaxID=77020 RepID=A0A0M8MTP8_9BASI|nr:hypothetical protein Malapachy_3716 [Malassezia pachydermatis]KOS14144.1 hypothetical protein Malapachy_3716 [Malassezia pachydermatis]
MNVFEQRSRKEQKLYHTSQERINYESLATLFSLITCLDFLERAYVRGAVPEDAYATECTRLLGQYKIVSKLVTDPSKPSPYYFKDVDAFMAHFQMDHPAAAHRLALGVPATIEHAHIDATATSSSNGGAHIVAEITQNFITLMDALKLRMRAKDQLHPLLSDLLSTYTQVSGGSGEARQKLLEWLITLNKLSASDEVDEAQAREMLFDIENAYNAWFKSLQNRV